MSKLRERWGVFLVLAASCGVALLAGGCRQGPGASSAYQALQETARRSNLQKIEADAQAFLADYGEDAKAANVLFMLGEAQHGLGKYGEGAATFQQLLRKYPAHERYMEAQYWRAECLFQSERFEEALEELNSIRSGGIQSQGAQEVYQKARYLRAATLAKLEEYIEAAVAYQELLELARTPKDRFDALVNIADLFNKARDFNKAFDYYRQVSAITDFPDDLGPVLLRQAEVALALGRHLEAVHAFSKVVDHNVYPALKEKGLARLNEWLSEFNDKETFVELVRRATGGLTGYRVHLAYVRMLEDWEEFEAALTELDRIENYYRIVPSIFNSREVSFLRERIQSKLETQTNRLGALLPLTGRYQVYAARMLRGAKLALDEHNDFNPAHPITLMTLNTEGNPQKARELATRLIKEERVLGIVGPVLPECIKAVAEEVDRFNVPLIVPGSGAPGLTDLSPYIFRNCITNRDQAETIVRFAVENLDLQRFAVMYPDNEFGRDLAEAFRDAVTEHGAVLAESISYAPDTEDFGKNMARLSRSSFEALFLPDHAGTAAQIIGQLIHSGIEVRQFLGSNLWNTSELLKLGGRYLEGAVFVDGFFAASPRPETRNFVSAYVEAYGEAPDLFAAQTYDSVRLLLHGRRSGGATRVQLAEQLFRIRDYRGATGELTVLSSGDTHRDLFVLTVHEGRIVPADAVPREQP
jgi:branched-chain amino acid transport system substrate-binding protein